MDPGLPSPGPSWLRSLPELRRLLQLSPAMGRIGKGLVRQICSRHAGDSIQDTSAIKSGVYSLPIVALFAVGLTFHSIVSGGVVRKTRLLQPVELAGALFATLCAGLLYGLSPNSSKAWYIGAHIRLGFGIGLANQVPITALQSFAKPEDLGFTMGIAFMAQPVAGRPSLDVGQVLFTGASEIRTVYSGADVDAILDAYMGGIKDVYTFSLASRSSFRCAVVLRHPIQKVGEL
ncbi:major facilitator superfamily transporter [Seiridium cupressi]